MFLAANQTFGRGRAVVVRCAQIVGWQRIRVTDNLSKCGLPKCGIECLAAISRGNQRK